MASITTSSLDTSPSNNIYIANGCGQLYFFQNVPDDVEEWFDDNFVGLYVNNNFSSCDWGFLDEAKGHTIQMPKPPVC